MAVVQKFDYWFINRNCRGEINFTVKNGFTIAMPVEIQNLLGIKEVDSDTLAGVKEKFEKVRKDFNERSDTYRKLILYRCKIRCCIVDREEPSESYSEGEIKKLILNKSDISNGFNREVDSTGITLDFIILYERENNGNFSYVDIEKKYKIQISDSGNKYKRMDWTQERENFFKRLKTSIEQVILKTNDFFEKPVDEVAAIIDDKINALSFKVEN